MDLKELKGDMPYKWKVQTAAPWGAMCVAYVDARQVMDKLDEIIGPGGWQTKYYTVKESLFCSIGIKIGEEWIWKSDIGTPSMTEKAKGEASDAFKRAAVKWGVGRFLYSLEMITLPTFKNKKGKDVPVSGNTGKALSAEQISITCHVMTKGNTEVK